MKNRSSLIIFFVLVFCACKKEDKPYVPVQRCLNFSRNIDTINRYINGTWEWLEEKRYDRDKQEYVYYTPNSPGWYYLTLKLSGDTAKFFVNNLPDSIYQFRIQRLYEITNYPPDSLPVIAYYSFFTGIRRNAIPVMICKDQLLMYDQMSSDIGGEHLWIRK